MKKKVLQALRTTLKAEYRAVRSIEKAVARDFPKAIDILMRRKGNIVVTGVGKSSFVGMKLAASLTSLGHTAAFLHPVEAIHGDLGMVSRGDVLIAFSFSGNSMEVVRIVEYVKRRFRTPIISITGTRHSALSKLSDAEIILSVPDEGSPGNIAPLASITAAMAAGDLVASGLVAAAPFSFERFAANHPGGTIGLSLQKVIERMRTGPRVPRIAPDAPLRDAIAEIDRTKTGIVGIIDKRQRLVGAITDGDIRRFVARHSSIKDIKVSACMTQNPKTIRKDETLAEAMQKMEKYKITSLFVTGKERRLIGLVHIHDILQ